MLKHKGVVVKKNWPMCEICGRKMAGERTLRLHMKKIHERPEQEFKCMVSGCGRSYPNEKFLRRHMDRHNGKRHKCPLCSADYKDKSQLKVAMLILISSSEFFSHAFWISSDSHGQGSFQEWSTTEMWAMWKVFVEHQGSQSSHEKSP